MLYFEFPNSLMKRILWLAIYLAPLCGQGQAHEYDIILRQGTIYDGLGGKPIVADVAAKGRQVNSKPKDSLHQ